MAISEGSYHNFVSNDQIEWNWAFPLLLKGFLKDYLNSCTKLKASTLVWNWNDKKKKTFKTELKKLIPSIIKQKNIYNGAEKLVPSIIKPKKKTFIMEQKS